MNSGSSNYGGEALGRSLTPSAHCRSHQRLDPNYVCQPAASGTSALGEDNHRQTAPTAGFKPGKVCASCIDIDLIIIVINYKILLSVCV